MYKNPKISASRRVLILCVVCAAVPILIAPAGAQNEAPAAPGQPLLQGQQAPAPGPSAAPLTLTLQDALARAQQNTPQVLAALSDVLVAREDVLQARAARRPILGGRSDYLGTQGNGKLASGRFVTNDGVHVYRDWATLHQDFTAAATGTAYRRAEAAEALARAKADVARRGLA